MLDLNSALLQLAAGDRVDILLEAISVMPGVWVYQLTDKGVALDAMVKGTKYYKDDDLN